MHLNVHLAFMAHLLTAVQDLRDATEPDLACVDADNHFLYTKLQHKRFKELPQATSWLRFLLTATIVYSESMGDGG